MSRTYRLAVLNSHPIQYFAPLYRRLACEPAIDLTVYYCTRQGAEEYLDPGFGTRVKWDIPLLEGYRYKFLPNLRGDRVDGFASLVNPAIVGEIVRGRYDAFWIHGYAYLSDWLALAAARLSRTPIFYHSESSLTYDARVARPLYVRIVKPRLLRFLFSQIDSFLAIGTLNEQFYRHFGARPDRIFHTPYAVDNDHFSSRAAMFRAQRDGLRAEMGVGPTDVVFLFAAKMTPKKAVLELLEAYGQLGSIPGKALVMVGEGELRPAAERLARDRGLRDVHFVGFAGQAELPKYYALSDVFVRSDGLYQGDWGLTVNEAMAAGLAVIATDSIGATVDLVRNGENGLVVRFGNIPELACAMQQMVADPARCREMGGRSSEIIRNWSYEECVQGVLRALQSLRREESTGN